MGSVFEAFGRRQKELLLTVLVEMMNGQAEAAPGIAEASGGCVIGQAIDEICPQSLVLLFSAVKVS